MTKRLKEIEKFYLFQNQAKLMARLNDEGMSAQKIAKLEWKDVRVVKIGRSSLFNRGVNVENSLGGKLFKMRVNRRKLADDLNGCRFVFYKDLNTKTRYKVEEVRHLVQNNLDF